VGRQTRRAGETLDVSESGVRFETAPEGADLDETIEMALELSPLAPGIAHRPAAAG
jgi:hypothetical protein